jgi:hypothetical protein
MVSEIIKHVLYEIIEARFRVIWIILLKTNKTPWPESATDRRLSAKLVPTFANRGCHVVSVTDPYGRILGFLNRFNNIIVHSKWFFRLIWRRQLHENIQLLDTDLCKVVTYLERRFFSFVECERSSPHSQYGTSECVCPHGWFPITHLCIILPYVFFPDVYLTIFYFCLISLLYNIGPPLFLLQ